MFKTNVDPAQRTLFESIREKKKILLVEPYYKRTLVPLPLMKISSLHKQSGDEVRYQRGEGWFINDYKPDIIYITSLFTWDYYTVVKTINSYKAKFPKSEIKVGGTCASLLSKDMEKDTGIKPHFGAWDEVDQIVPDYSLFPSIGYSLGVTTRSCIRKCPWCFSWRIEGEYREIKNWDKFINLSKPRIIFMDNNFLACSDEHFYGVIKKLKEINKPFDFNQSLDCYDKKTEVLTRDGWKFLKDVTFSDKIATLKNGKELEYQRPLAKIKKRFKGKLIHFKAQSLDLMVTPKHNIYFKYYYKYNNRIKYYTPPGHEYIPNRTNNRKEEHFEEGYRLKKAKELLTKTNLNFKRDAVWNGKEIKWFILKGIDREHLRGWGDKHELELISKRIYMDDFVKFLGWYLSEGSYNKREVQIHQCVNEDYKQEISQLISKMGFKYRTFEDRIKIYDTRLSNYVKQFGHAKDKFIPTEIKSLCKRQLLLLWDTLSKGDGDGKNQRYYYSLSKKLVEDVQEIVLKIGYASRYGIKTKKGTKFYAPRNKKMYKYSGDLYELGITKTRTYPRIQNFTYKRQITKTDYNGMVYCVTVPNGIIYVRRNGYAVWCGNCRVWAKREDRVKALSETKIFPTRFSFDGMHQDGILQDAMTLAKKYGIGGDIRVDVLYGFKDSPEDFYYRLKEIVCLGGKAFPMRYQELTAKERNTYIGEHWTANLIRGFQKLLSLEFSSGIMGPTSDSKEMFERKCGKNAQEFIEKIDMFEKREDPAQRRLEGDVFGQN